MGLPHGSGTIEHARSQAPLCVDWILRPSSCCPTNLRRFETSRIKGHLGQICGPNRDILGPISTVIWCRSLRSAHTERMGSSPAAHRIFSERLLHGPLRSLGGSFDRMLDKKRLHNGRRSADCLSNKYTDLDTSVRLFMHIIHSTVPWLVWRMPSSDHALSVS